MRRPRRNHTAAFKAKVAVAALKGDKTLAELAEKFDLHANQITQWRTQLLEGASDVFMTPAEKRDTGPSTKACKPKSASRHWKLIFWPAPSVASAMRAQRNDRRHTPIADAPPGRVAGDLTLEFVLPTAPDIGCRLGVDAADRRAALELPVCR